MELLAKPDESLKKHSEKTKEIIDYLIKYYPPPSIVRGSKKVSKDKEKFIKALKLSALLHDIGKADYRFQNYIRNKQSKSPPHALLSLSILKEIFSIRKFPEWISNLMILIVASHHSPYYGGLYNDCEDLQWSPETDFENLINILNDWKLSIKKENVLRSKPYQIFNNARNYISDNSNFLWRELLVYSQGLLIRADYYASSNSIPKKGVAFPVNIIGKDKSLYWHQKEVQQINQNIFIQIPTGRGKTETALLWAKQFKKPNLFYILPTTASINAMYYRFLKKFRDEQVGIYHSKYESLLLEEEKLEQGQIFKYFLKPINITTPDQLLLILMNYKKFPPREVIFSNSVFIFDEIHIYDAYTFFLIKWLIKILKGEYNAKICVMSATFPKFFQEELNFLNARKIGNENQILKEYKDFRRTKPIIKNDFLKNKISLIIDEFKKGKKVLVVVNTIQEAQKIYSILKNENKIPLTSLMLLHSKFIAKDRQEKEKRILKGLQAPFILVSTQVVEVSLDIDFDILFTELAYFDSLVQRFGRVNRFGNKEKFPVYIFKPETSDPYEEDFLRITLELLKQQKFESEADYLLLTDNFYNKIKNKLKEQIKELEKENPFEKIWEKLNYIAAFRINEVEGQKLLRTRRGILQIPMIPSCFYNEIQKIEEKIKQTTDRQEKMKLILLKKEYYVDVPIYLAKKFSNPKNPDFIDLDYNSDYGLFMDIENNNFI